ncbi:MAG: PDZ domain-containing protein, partial [Candidatus Cloacimonas sp.]|nr:PDZ domain-containing protein [Candidatus Cloacimonadota bacterium]
ILPQEITADLQQSLELKQIGGVLVAKVEKDTPAEKGGLKNGDVILKFNYESVKNVSHFRILVANAIVGKRIPVEVVRNNQRKSLYVILTELSSTEGNNSQPAKQNSHWLGLDVQGLTDDFATKNQIVADFGVVITKVTPNTPAQRAGLKPGMVIQEINRQKVSDLVDYNKLTTEAKGKFEKEQRNIILLYVLSGSDDYQYITVNLAE